MDVTLDFKDKIPSNEWNSLFIPSLPPIFIDEELLIYIIEEIYLFGQVKRVDIVKKENSNNRLMAFIHMDFWYKNSSTLTFRQKIEKEGQVDVYGFYNSYNIESDYCDFLSHAKEGLFIRFMINKTPIKDTELNIHQIADLLEKADLKMTEQQMRIEQLERELEETKKRVEFLENQSIHQNIHLMDSDNISDIEELDDYLYQKELEKPKLVRECYIDSIPTFDEDSILLFDPKKQATMR